jgi:prevent-host-death family protein
LDKLVRKVAISEFKAKCLSLLDEVHKTKKPLLITKFGKPVAEVVPPSINQESRGWLGSMKGEIKFLGDILSPVFDESDWKETE